MGRWKAYPLFTETKSFSITCFAPQTLPNGSSDGAKQIPGPRLHIRGRVIGVEVVKELIKVGCSVLNENGVEFENIVVVDAFSNQCVLYGRLSIVAEVSNNVHVRTF